VAEAAYGAIITSNGRQAALREAATMFFVLNHEFADEQQDFDVLLKHFSAAATLRNNVAHGCLIHYQVDDRDCGHFLEPPWYNSLKSNKTKMELNEATGTQHWAVKYRYVSADIAAFRDKFRQLRNATQDFYLSFFPRLVTTAPRVSDAAPG
jgi:hypothetical protein